MNIIKYLIFERGTKDGYQMTFLILEKDIQVTNTVFAMIPTQSSWLL